MEGQDCGMQLYSVSLHLLETSVKPLWATELGARNELGAELDISFLAKFRNLYCLGANSLLNASRFEKRGSFAQNANFYYLSSFQANKSLGFPASFIAIAIT